MVQSSDDFVQTLTTILASARIPARMVHGLRLESRQSDAQMLTWLEVHDGNEWRYFNPRTGDEALPSNFLVWWRGNEPLISVEGELTR